MMRGCFLPLLDDTDDDDDDDDDDDAPETIIRDGENNTKRREWIVPKAILK